MKGGMHGVELFMLHAGETVGDFDLAEEIREHEVVLGRPQWLREWILPARAETERFIPKHGIF